MANGKSKQARTALKGTTNAKPKKKSKKKKK